MTPTADLFEQPIARKRDPATSTEAAKRYTETKRRKVDAELVHDVILQHPGHTAAEISDILIRVHGLHWYKASRMPGKRISDLLDAGRLILGKDRKCEITGHVARTYYAQP